ncbi:hypothetical protein A3A54_01410 [Candidatus Curtissbacteria bacterium RIFCSPLOWO2_01_FULL_39_62]|uniref:Uncharacterized protein n=2 Tax=Candidatus Curtissiibacteriota TaxID=1752717 RepID=A0A1F5GC57_9BACT|nr:MAG: hypothetical protein A3D04_04555 [Candidatus Curtissbacteria bacterium RIFCSPHIGHO2_02_FULL_40_16b]OGE00627.1 MAG: hypothetical protein A3J17_03060 [Candidatus Curtissbacteria bacterium RIFCSPLOWO2_02_FULL_40_11]OGE00892.1 MAG: hypothetical protein A3A54_01410 [Candidatus Curtissbacteria bacterium RIFCSPLOWO2_01_FULL_39_62]OGE13608.1 MAG: hypothetical protein A3G14_02860 [Candidatus Curtissbacteria bacterium RIFCSPLOWO2_12_FULL_38_9]
MLKNTIVAKLNEIEKEKQVKILYAVESGSRAWGFESKDSDYDVRFIFASRKPRQKLNIWAGMKRRGNILPRTFDLGA